MPAFSQKLFDELCDRLGDGTSLRKICAADDMPSTTAVMKWLAKDGNETLVAQYARAREVQADALFDDCLAIADKFDGSEMNDPEHIQRARLRIDTRKWMAGKLRPKVYGDKLAIGGDKTMDPIQTEEMTSQETARRVAFLFRSALEDGKDGD